MVTSGLEPPIHVECTSREISIPSNHLATVITYIGSPDTTFSGSWSSLLCALLWTHISTHSYEAQVRKVLLCLGLTKYAYEKLKMLEKELKLDLWVTRSHEYALTVLFRWPNNKIVFKYILSSEKLLVNDGEMLEERL